MPKKIRKTPEPPSPKPAAEQTESAYPAKQEDLDQQRLRVRKAAAAGAETLKSPPPPPSEPPTPKPAVPARSLTKVEMSWPSKVGSAGAPKPPDGQAQGQKGSAAAPAPQAAPATPTSTPKPPVASVPATTPTPKAVTPQTLKPTASQPVSVSFALVRPDARQVSLSGEFNGWSPNATPMQRHDDGHWEATVALAPGRYQYKFVVDGQWIPDPSAHENAPNPHGTLNSVVEVRP